jgi:hypothetical protein
MHTVEGHRNKRPFQPSITSYFAHEPADHLRGQGPTARLRTQHHRTTQQGETLAPEVPGHVQANLLSVGMRVRKSVPEGYKTHKMSALPSIQTTLSAPSTTITLDVKPPRDPVPDDFVHQRELLPFCGLHKIGGLGFADQPTTNIHLYAGVDATGHRPPNMFTLPAEAFTQPFSSQGSTDSGYSSETLRPNPLNPSKRSWIDEDDRPLNTNFFFRIPAKGAVEVEEVPVSPLSETPEQGMNLLGGGRQYAQPKSRRPGIRSSNTGGSFESEESMELDLENRHEGQGDFDEAGFLVGGEVDMGGM